MIVDDKIMDALTAQAKASPRLRMNLDLRNSPEDKSQRMLNSIEPGTVMPIHRHRSSSETVLYTMTVESRPSGSLAKGSGPCSVREARCLYTGDFDSVENDSLWNRFTKTYVYSSIGTVQIPHHGSKHNWRQEFLVGAPLRFFISVGTTNTYHHPDFWGVKDVCDVRSHIDVITEKDGTGQEIQYWIEL